MNAWKLLGLWAVLATAVACDTGGVFVGAPPTWHECRVGGNSCPEGKHCIGLDGHTYSGAPGTCQESVECHVGDDSCPEEQHCVGISSNRPGAPGVCQRTPADARCFVGQNALCGLGFICIGVDRSEDGAPGICKDTAECRIGSATNTCQESNGYICVGLGGEEDGTPGTCRDIAECRMESATPACNEENGYACKGILSQDKGAAGICEDVAECRVGDEDKACATGICVSDSHSGKGASGTCHEQTLGEACGTDEECLPGEVCEGGLCAYGLRDEGGGVVPTLSNFHILVHGQYVVPLRADNTTQDDLNGGWVGPGPAQMRLLARGPGADTGLVVETALGDSSTTCAPDAPACSAMECEWLCEFPPGWAGEGPETTVRVGLGLAKVQVWTYHVSSAPSLSFLMPQAAMVGETLEICLNGVAMDAPLHALLATSIQVLDGAAPLALSWTAGALTTESGGHVGQKCWTAPLPLSLAWSSATLALQVFAEAEDAVGDVTEATYNGPLALTRIACASHYAASVSAPLSWVGGRLAFVAASILRLFDAEACTQEGEMRIGSIDGPMVALEDGTLAVATKGRGGPTGRTTSRLFLVDASTPVPAFLQEASMDCAVGAAGTDATAFFDKGLALLSASPPRYAAPANAETDAVLVAYSPFAPTAAERCIGSNALGAPVELAPAQDDSGEVVFAYGNTYANALSTRQFYEASRQWGGGSWTATQVSTGNLMGLALGHPGTLCLSADTKAPVLALQVWKDGSEVPGNYISPVYRFFPPAIDSQGALYAVGYNTSAGSGSSYELHRLSTDGATPSGMAPTGITSTLPTGTVNGIVGSPLLGEPEGEGSAELYLISGNGRVFAFEAATLRRLWMVELGFNVSNTAQPVLTAHAEGGGTLWVVGTQGQVRGLRVSSNGLNKTAPWPKAFHDNCNTGSKRVKPDEMPGCF